MIYDMDLNKEHLDFMKTHGICPTEMMILSGLQQEKWGFDTD
jgi:hypothetical protein